MNYVRSDIIEYNQFKSKDYVQKFLDLFMDETKFNRERGA